MPHKHFLFLFILNYFLICRGCQIEGINSWTIPLQLQIYDVDRGVILSRQTSDINAISEVSFSSDPALNGGPYLNVSLVGSEFRIETNDEYPNYEEYETQSSVPITVDFACSTGTTQLLLIINIIDTNNNAPLFQPSDVIEFTIIPPVPPGFHITDCLTGLITRDIDLTTQRIEYSIEENPYIAIESVGSTVAKEWESMLITTTLIRSLSEPLELLISATDVDLTGDPPLTTNARVRIVADTTFQFPEEPLFSEAIYFANVTNGYLVLESSIYLKQGFDELVTFEIDASEYSSYFQIGNNENEVSVSVQSQLPDDLDERQIFLIIRANREYTSGDSAAIVVQLSDNSDVPAVLRFEKNNYVGYIENNVSTLEAIILSEGYSENVKYDLQGGLQDYFDIIHEDSIVSINLIDPLPESVLLDNSFIILDLNATDEDSIPAFATIIFEIIRNTTLVNQLVFSSPYYTGSYTEETETVALNDVISLAQGYSETVQFYLEGDSALWFEVDRFENSVSLSMTNPIPKQILETNQQLIFTIRAEIDENLIARSTIVILLPDYFINTSQVLGFEKNSYVGSIDKGVSTLEPILLSEGYSDDVSFSLRGDLVSYFTHNSQGAIVTVTLSTSIAEENIPPNNIVILELYASAENSISAHTTLVFEIVTNSVILEDQPVFSSPYYTGSYIEETETVSQDGVISLIQGYDETAEFYLEGEATQWFSLNRTENAVNIVVSNALPQQVLANNQQLLMAIRADIEGKLTAYAAVVILLPNNSPNTLRLLGFEKINYIGAVENDISTLEPIYLNTGYEDDVDFTLRGDLQEYFTKTSQDEIVTITLTTSIPEESLPPNKIVILELHATAENSISAYTTIVFEIIQESATVEEEHLMFSNPYYTGSYNSETETVTLDEFINLTQGYNDNVEFHLEGESAQWFSIRRTENSVTLAVLTPISQPVLANYQQLIFVIRAQNEGNITARATVVILLPDEISDTAQMLGFEKINYIGFIKDNESTLEPIILSEGYTNAVQFTLRGDLEEYFTKTSQDETVTITLTTAIPEESLPSNKIVILELHAIAENSISAYTTIVFEIIQESATVEEEHLIFSNPYYTGSYNSETETVTLDEFITLTQGYNDNVEFHLEGESAQWFSIRRTENSVTLAVLTPISQPVLANYQQLIFVIRAQNEGNITARATVVILLPDEISDTAQMLGFEKINYIGFIKDNESTLEPIILSEGYTNAVQFTLRGDLEEYFTKTSQDETVTITLTTAIPEESLPSNKIVILELHATAENSISAYTTIVFEIIQESATVEEEHLMFSNPYYTGSYNSETETVTLDEFITLTQGYNDNVEFHLEGESAQWFSIRRTENSVTLAVLTPISQPVLANYQQLIFVIRAHNEGNITARATVVILLPDEISDTAQILGFEKINYFGFIKDDESTLEPIILSEGYTNAVQFTLRGDLEEYFTKTSQDETVTITLTTAIPEESLPSNKIIILELHATAENSISAYTTIVFEIIQESATVEEEHLMFSNPYYTGSYNSETETVTLDEFITLTQGYNDNVEFHLEGESAQWFSIHRTENLVTLAVLTPISQPVLANYQQLIFVIRAHNEGNITARATVVILLPDEISDTAQILGFEKINYFGFIKDDESTLEPIILSEGYTNAVQFTLRGDLEEYFTKTSQDETVTITLTTAIPEESLPSNKIIILELHATAENSISAYTTIVFEIIQESATVEEEHLMFSNPYYTGSYNSETETVTLDEFITLTQGYNDNVEFHLEGESAQWFSIHRTENLVTLAVLTPISQAVLANYQQLLFVIRAENEGSITARATVVVLLPDEILNTAQMLGFEKINYVGSIENDVSTLEPIILSEGYTDAVLFSLRGDLVEYFDYTSQGAIVTVTLTNIIPEGLLPSNNIVILELFASAEDSISAYATIVFEVIINSGSVIEQLEFSYPYYIGSYNQETETVILDELVSLSKGYSDDVEFYLEGDPAQWFSISRTENSVLLNVITPVPQQVLANNKQLIFIIRAENEQSLSARAIFIILLSEGSINTIRVLGFESINYLGEINSNSSTLEPITLSEGYLEDVSFSFRGEFEDYFVMEPQNATVYITLSRSLPDESLANNSIVILELFATAQDAISAYATIVFRIVNLIEEPESEMLQFDEILYSGIIQNYLVMHDQIRLIGHTNEIVQLIGDYAYLFKVNVISGVVNVQLSETEQLPSGLVNVPLELVAATAKAVLLLNVLSDSDIPDLPTVTFSSELYIVRTNIAYTGFIGQVSASADTGEPIIYSLLLQNDNLQQRISINNFGEIHVSSTISSGIFEFDVIANTIFTQVYATAKVHLTVEALVVCGEDNNLVVPPLIVVDIDEEEPHENIVPIDSPEYENCTYVLTNRWPVDQNWLYVNEKGLHATAIDREHSSIAHMALSQIQVELVLHCDYDEVSRNKRSTNTDARPDWLGYYDYGSFEWVLTDTIQYNSRRTLVNLIVNDINDNIPIFVGKENEPIIIGYPVPDLLGAVLPRALTQVMATDADVGINAALLYWSDDLEISVSPITGNVHVRDEAVLEDGRLFTVNATDQNGTGLTGSLLIKIRLLSTHHIAVITVIDAFLDDERFIVSNLSSAVGYDIKVLSSSIVPDYNMIGRRNDKTKREVSTSSRVSIRLFIYGLYNEEPVLVERLIEDLTNTEVSSFNVISTVPLDDHLENLDTSDGNIGLLVSAIVLAILLFAALLFIGVWFFLEWRKRQLYGQFSDDGSLVSQNRSIESPPKLELLTQPKIDIEELKKSERRLQERLDAPDVSRIPKKTSIDQTEEPIEILTDTLPYDAHLPIVIQSIDKLKDAEEGSEDEDEFGEIRTNKPVVTFNENVEKYIHVLDDLSPNPDVEVFKF